ncbi:MAG: von Willebrand factor type A domain-containing protein, partial [Planctomycetia bacterium]|nr:von Willebrand factor type A domain-containing protein [Planctomycetia bacterium]
LAVAPPQKKYASSLWTKIAVAFLLFVAVRGLLIPSHVAPPQIAKEKTNGVSADATTTDATSADTPAEDVSRIEADANRPAVVLEESMAGESVQDEALTNGYQKNIIAEKKKEANSAPIMEDAIMVDEIAEAASLEQLDSGEADIEAHDEEAYEEMVVAPDVVEAEVQMEVPMEAPAEAYQRSRGVPHRFRHESPLAPTSAMERDSRPEPPPRPTPMPIPMPLPIVPPVPPVPNRDSFETLEENSFQTPQDAPFSTFGVDVDTASYTFMRNCLTERNQLPPKDSVRVEEYVNYFRYALEPPPADAECPFATTVEIQPHPWHEGFFMAKVALKGKELDREKRQPLNLVFLVDVSGSMDEWNKLPLVKDGLGKLLDNLNESDRVAIVTYANDTNLALPPTSIKDRHIIEQAILKLRASGGTYGEGGLQLAYKTARENFDNESMNRVVLCTDGDFNVGITNNEELSAMIEREAKSGVFLTILGFGMGNYHDDRLKELSSKGNGVYGYIDSRAEAKRMLCDNMVGSLVTIAKDVKIQVEFNPSHVAAYRLIGYEKRKLQAEDFHNDKKDSGDIGAGHSVVALYEIVPVGAIPPDVQRVDAPRYQTPPAEGEKSAGESEKESAESAVPEEVRPEWLFVKLRYKKPDENESSLIEFPVEYHPTESAEASEDFRFASGVALFALLLRDSDYAYNATIDDARRLVEGSVGEEAERKEFCTLIEKAMKLR